MLSTGSIVGIVIGVAVAASLCVAACLGDEDDDDKCMF